MHLARLVASTLARGVLARFAGTNASVVVWVMLWTDSRHPDSERHRNSAYGEPRARDGAAGTARSLSCQGLVRYTLPGAYRDEPEVRD